jgi:hypothetical protein
VLHVEVEARLLLQPAGPKMDGGKIKVKNPSFSKRRQIGPKPRS